MKKQKIYYFNKWVSSKSKKKFIRKGFINNRKIEYSECNNLDLINVIKSAKIGFKNNSEYSLKERSQILEKISKIIKLNINLLARLECLETGKTYENAFNEIKYSSELWVAASKLAKRSFDYNIKQKNGVNVKIVHEPVGIVALLIPWNFPFIVLSERLPFIIAAGNSAIIKPSEYASQSIVKFLELIKEIKIKSGVFNLITGSKEIGNLLVKNKNTNMVSFTGSTQVGKKIMKTCSNSIKRISLELGGKNSMIILKDANLSTSINNLISSFTVNAGQACVGISKVFVHSDIVDEFLKKFLFKLNKIKNFKKLYGPISTDNQYKKIQSIIIKSKKYDKFIIYGKFKKNDSRFVKPIIYYNLPKKCLLNDVEIFGPILSILSYDKNINAINSINNSKYGLSCVIMGKDKKNSYKVARKINAGRIWINQAVTKNYANIPIGGFKQSGLNRECGVEGIKNYTELKSIIIKSK